MDWRERDYYLVTTDIFSYDMRHKYYKIASPSLKRHAPYNHFKNIKCEYDGGYREITGMNYVQEMLSCRKEESKVLEYELNKGVRNDDDYTRFFKLNKEVCGQ